jgi:hypothetical protein
MPAVPGAARAAALNVRPLGDPPTPRSAVVHCADGSTQVFILVPGDPGYGNASVLLCSPTTGGGTGTSSSSTVAVVQPAPGQLPSISAQPLAASVKVGDLASFSVTASAPSGVSYQWRRDGNPIAGATASSYSFVAALADDGSTYGVIVSNRYGQAVSSAATLTVTTDGKPAITQAPSAVSTSVGSTAGFTVAAKGAAPLNYQWSFNGAPLADRAATVSVSGIAGSQSATLTLGNVQLGDAGTYSVMVSNAQGPDVAATADLIVSAAPSSTWTRLLGSSGSEFGNAVALDAYGKLYIAGFTTDALDGQTSAGGNDAYLTQYNAAGLKQWTRQFGGSGSDMAQSVAVDAGGNVYVVGTTYAGLDGNGTAGFRDAFIVKFGATGQRLWMRQFGGTGDDMAESVTTDAAGDIYVAGYTGSPVIDGQTGAAGGSAFLTQYHADGTVGWLRLWGGTGSTQAYGVAADAGGHVHVVGAGTGSVDGQPHTTAPGDYDVFVTSFDAATGVKRWTREWGSDQSDFGRSIAADASGNLYVAGTTNGIVYGSTNRPPSSFLTKLDTTGAVQWGVQWTVGDLYDSPGQVALDASGNAYVVGTAYSTGSVVLFVSKFDASGAAKGVYLHGSDTLSVQVEGDALAIGSNGQGYVGGGVNGGPFDGNSNAGAYDAYVHMFALP